MRILIIILFGLTVSSARGAGESIGYRYQLVKSKDDQLCRHMTTVYNEYFSHPFDAHTLSTLQKDSAVPIESRYPSSPEFDAINWNLKTYPLTRSDGRKDSWTALIARIDVNNDGVEDIVIKSSFFRGDPDDREELFVFSASDFDLESVKDAREFLVGQSPSGRPRVINLGAAILRPFVVRGKTYLSGYDYKRYTNLPGVGTARNAAHTPPQYMRVYRYDGGGQVFSGAETPLQIVEICVVRMSHSK